MRKRSSFANQKYPKLANQGTTSDQALLLQLNAGSKEAFTQLYERYYGSLYIHAYSRLKSREESQDLVHDLFASIWANRESLIIRQTFSAYLYSALRNRILDLIAKKQLNSAYVASLASFMADGINNTDHALREHQLAALIEAEVSKLPRQLRKVFELSRKEQLSHKEIAARLKISENTVRGYIKDVLRILRTKINFWLILIIFFIT